MSAPKRPDELLLRYSEACAQDERRPASAVRDAVRAHAAMLIRAHPSPLGPSITHAQPAANQSRWKLSLLASVALVGMTTLLVLQFDRGTPEEQELALGRPTTNATNTQPAPAPTAPPQPRATTAEKSGDLAPAPAPANTPRADVMPQAKLSPPAAKDELFKEQRPVDATQGAAVSDASPGATAAPAPAPAMTEPTVPSLRRPDATPAPARAMGGLEANGAGARSDNTAQRATKALAAPEAADASRQQLEQPELQMKRSEQRSDKDAASANALNTRLLDSARSGQLAELERLLQRGALINSTDQTGRTALILAAMHGHTATVARLLALGANPALTDHDGLSALQHARELGLTQIVRLLEAGP